MSSDKKSKIHKTVWIITMAPGAIIMLVVVILLSVVKPQWVLYNDNQEKLAAATYPFVVTLSILFWIMILIKLNITWA